MPKHLHLTALVLVCFSVACAKKIDGPTPSLTALSNERAPSIRPGVVCNAQGDPAHGWPVDLLGDGFSPLPEGLLTSNASVVMPTVAVSGPQSWTLPSDHVYFVDKTRLVADFPTADSSPAESLPPGTYGVTVTNPNGHSVQLADGLMVVPPPTITSAAFTTPVTQTTDGVVEIDGTGFRVGQTPAVVISGAGLPTVSLTGVKVASTTTLTATVPANTAEGTYDVTVTNPEGCAAVLPGGLVISYNTLGLLTMDPRFGWKLKNQPITIYDAPTGTEKNFSGGAPQVWLVAPLAADGGTVSIPMRRVAYVSPTVITAVVPDCSGLAATPTNAPTCPDGIAPGGPYSIKIKDPSGATGQIPASTGFSVLNEAPPSITAISPSSITTTGISNLAITGQGFDSGSPAQSGTAQIGFQVTGGIEFCDLPLHSGGTVSDTEIDVDVPASLPASSCVVYAPDGTITSPAPSGFAMSEGLYLIRVQHGADVGYGDYSGLIVTSTSYNPTAGPPISTLLAEPLMDFPLVAASDDIDGHFLYALGGTDAKGATANVELAGISEFGDIGGECSGNPSVCKFRLLDRTAGPNLHQGQLGVTSTSNTPVPITGATAIVRQATEPCGSTTCTTSYIFLIGGEGASGALSTIYRAQVLRNADAPVTDDSATADTTTGSLAAGTYYYRVSAVEVTTDPDNPGGETLASDGTPGQLDAKGSLTVRWTCVPGAAQYKIYRTVNPNDPSGTEKLLDTVTAIDCSTPTKQSYPDDGSKTPAGDGPLPPGALGNWVSVGSLATARSHAKAVRVGDDVWIAGGTGASGDLASVEHLAFKPGTATFVSNTATPAGTLQMARSKADALISITHANAPNDVPADAGYLLVVGGESNGTVINGNGNPVLELATIAPDGGTTWSVPTYSSSQIGNEGGWAEVQADNFFVEGTQPSSTLFYQTTTGGICSKTGPCPVNGPADFDFSLNSPGGTSGQYQFGSPRYLVGERLFRAYIYTAGGASSTTGGTLTDTLERVVY